MESLGNHLSDKVTNDNEEVGSVIEAYAEELDGSYSRQAIEAMNSVGKSVKEIILVTESILTQLSLVCFVKWRISRDNLLTSTSLIEEFM